jgi:hypothetical protein
VQLYPELGVLKEAPSCAAIDRWSVNEVFWCFWRWKQECALLCVKRNWEFIHSGDI